MQRKPLILMLITVVLACQSTLKPSTLKETATMVAPVAKRIDHSFSHHGITIEDPYHWLKDQSYPTVDDADVLAYLGQENDFYEQQMAPMKAFADELFAEMKHRQPKEDVSVPFKDGEYFYRWAFAKDAQYRVWARTKIAEPENWHTLLDEPKLAEGHDYFRLGSFSVSPDGRYLAYSVDTNGSERYVLKVKDLITDKLSDVHIDNHSGAPVWSADSQTFFYLKVNENWQPYLVKKHQLNTSTSDDLDVYEEKDSSFFVGISATQSDDYIVISTGDHVTNEQRIIPSATPEAKPLLIAPRRTGHQYDLEHHGSRFYIHSNATHKNFTLLSVDVNKPSEDNWQFEIEGSQKHYLLDVVCFQNFIAITERIDGLDQIRLRRYPEQDTEPGSEKYSGKDHYIKFPEAAYSVGLGDNMEYDVDKLRLEYESLTTPDTIYDYQINNQELVVKKVQEIPSGYNAQDFHSERMMVTARDGVQVPVSLVYKSPRQANSPLYLYAYGAYGSATQPWFSSVRLSLLERGFVFAIAHVRGGDELGYHWYEDGKLNSRTNTFNDFIDVAQSLAKKRYTEPGKLFIAGGSAGGELMGAVANQAPELWGGVAAHVPFVDVLNTMLDTSLPLTPMEWPEWGNPIEDKEAFEYIRSYSPYDQLEAKDYPPMFVTAGLNDPRVTYWEPAKYVAKLRAIKTDNNPILFKTNMGAGHGGKSGRFDSLYETAEEYAFFLTLAERGIE